MAIKLTGPAENSVLIDANITEIILSHTDLQEHYHFAKFYLDDVFFDELVIPRISTSKMVLQFSNLLLKSIVFPTIHDSSIINYRMDRRLRIEVFKNKQNASALVNTFNYTLRYSTQPTRDIFEASTLKFIDVAPDVFVIGTTPRILIPVYSLKVSNIHVQVIDDNGHIYYNGYYSTQPANKTFLIQLSFNLLETSNYLTLKITSEVSSIKKHFRVLRNSLYEPKKIIFYNKFGYPVQVELFGKLAIKDDLVITSYENGLGILKTAEVKEETIFTVDTGYLTEKERGIVSQIVNSLDTKIKIGADFISCVPTVKSITTYTDGEFVTQNQLSFKLNKNPKFKN